MLDSPHDVDPKAVDIGKVPQALDDDQVPVDVHAPDTGKV